MELFFRAAALIVTAAIAGILLKKENGAVAVLLSLCACCLVLTAGAEFLEPVVTLMEELRKLSGIGGDMLSILLKTAGVSIVAEIASLICTDAGEGALGKTIDFLAGAAIVWLCLPLFQELLDLLQTVLGEL